MKNNNYTFFNNQTLSSTKMTNYFRKNVTWVKVRIDIVHLNMTILYLPPTFAITTQYQS